MDPSDLRPLALSDHREVRARFLEHLGPAIDRVLVALANAGSAIELYEAGVPPDQRSLRVLEFLFLAFNSLVVSLNLLTAGLLIPAGNIMRHFAEATAMALLCSHPSLSVLEQFDASPTRFPVHTAPNRILRRGVRKTLGIDEESWTRFVSVAKHYDQLSHASILALAITYSHSAGRPTLGSHFDETLLEPYAIELGRIGSAASVLEDITTVLTGRLSSRRPGG